MDHSSLPATPSLLIVNPVSGQKRVLHYLPEIVRTLMDGGYLVTVAATACSRCCRCASRRPRRSCRSLCAAF